MSKFSTAKTYNEIHEQISYVREEMKWIWTNFIVALQTLVGQSLDKNAIEALKPD